MRLFLDVDGVLADFSAGWLEMAREETGWKHGNGVITHWNAAESLFFAELAKATNRDAAELDAAVWKRVNRVGFCAGLSVIEGAREFVQALGEIEGVEVEYLTTPMDTSPTWTTERKEWLHRHFGAKAKDVHFSAKKGLFRGNMLLDDKPSNCLEWARENFGGRALLWDAPYNAAATAPDDVAAWTRVRSFREALEAVKDRLLPAF